MKSLLDQFRDHIADKSVDALHKLRVDLLTRSVGGGEQGPMERGAVLAYVTAIDELIASRNTALVDRGGRPLELTLHGGESPFH